MGTITFLAVILLVVGIHEMGHYLACKAFGIRVNQFAIGVGPKLLGFRSTNTEWNLRILPIGGYITMDEEQISSAAPWKKAIVAVAGPLINLLPFIVLGLVYLGIGPVARIMWHLYVESIQAFGSILLHSIDFFHYFYPVVTDASGKVAKVASDDVVGVVGMGSVTNHAVAKLGAWTTFIIMFSLTSIGLAMFNLIPLPPLDGGRIVIAGVEQVAGKSIADKVAVVLGLTGVVLVLWLLLVVTFRDISHLF